MKPRPPARHSEWLAPRQPVPITPAGHLLRLEESCVLIWEQGQQAGIGPEGHKDCRPSTPAWTEGLPRGMCRGHGGHPPISFRALVCWSASQHTAKLFQPSSSSTQTARNYTSEVKITLQVNVQSHVIGYHAGVNPERRPRPRALCSLQAQEEHENPDDPRGVSGRLRARGHSRRVPPPHRTQPPAGPLGEEAGTWGICCHREATVLQTSPFTWWRLPGHPTALKGSMRRSWWRVGSQSDLRVQKTHKN